MVTDYVMTRHTSRIRMAPSSQRQTREGNANTMVVQFAYVYYAHLA